MMKLKIIGLIIGVCFFAGCTATSGGNPADATLAYLNALANKDKTAVVQYACKSWEEQANLEVDALMSVGANLSNAKCQKIGNEGEFELVNCTGTLDLTYNDEIRSIDLASRTYIMTMEGNSWRVCSYR